MFTELYLNDYVATHTGIIFCFSFSDTKEELHKVMSVFTTRLYEDY